ncbi:hypothetical protein [Streptomyces sp. RerS4]|uniref:hypothetical protein n=1 Tax=Streptomyces sp. RerS4 TaxID=2942449 RepID=UPI00201C2ACB|nr:hypothetical protein [Streptomyces sp. RerS4]UQX01773.1 hypothetical protein M4D82_15600 [Streptomyces sp. RerS4]
MSAVVVDTYATGLLTTTVTALPDGGHRWLRRPGTKAPAAFTPLTARLRELVEEPPSPARGTRLLTGDPAPHGARTYAAPGPYSVAHWLIDGGGPQAVPGGHRALRGTLREVGALLAALHSRPVPEEARRPARAVVRLHAWLSGRTTAGGATAADLLGAAGVAHLRAWAAEAAGPAAGHVLSHGAPGLGSLVPGVDGSTTAALLTGEDLCVAPPHFDLGWLAGELAEFRWLLGATADQRAWQQLLDALFDGYGEGGGDVAAREGCLRGTALRIALHTHDTAAYVPDAAGQARLYGLLAATLTEGAAA